MRFLLVLLFLFPVSATAEPIKQFNVVLAWYEALQASDATKVETLLSQDAEIVLADIGAEQTREEFIDSLEQWKTAIKDGMIRLRLTQSDNDKMIVKVCYDFAANQQLVNEVMYYTYYQDEVKISKIEAAPLGDRCDF